MRPWKTCDVSHACGLSHGCAACGVYLTCGTWDVYLAYGPCGVYLTCGFAWVWLLNFGNQVQFWTKNRVFRPKYVRRNISMSMWINDEIRNITKNYFDVTQVFASFLQLNCKPTLTSCFTHRQRLLPNEHGRTRFQISTRLLRTHAEFDRLRNDLLATGIQSSTEQINFRRPNFFLWPRWLVRRQNNRSEVKI